MDNSSATAAERQLERECLGSLVVSSTILPLEDLAKHLPPAEMFSYGNHSTIAQAAHDLLNRNIAPDTASLFSYISDSGRRGIAAEVFDLATVSAPLLAPACRAVRDNATRRTRLLALRAALVAEESGNAVDPQQLVSTLQNAAQRRETALHSQRDIYSIGVKRYAQLLSEAGASLLRIGCPALDEVLGPLDRGCMTVIGARPSVGKSATALYLAEVGASRGVRVSILSLEDSPFSWASRLVARRSGLSAADIRQGRPLGNAEGEIARGETDTGDGWELIDLRGAKLADIVSTIDTKVRAHRSDVVIVDYLQKVRKAGRTQDRRNEIDEALDEIKAACGRVDAHLFMMSQLSRKKGDDSKRARPDITDLKESGGIEEKAENVLLMWRDFGHEGSGLMRYMQAPKVKDGEPGTKLFVKWNTVSACVETITRIEGEGW